MNRDIVKIFSKVILSYKPLQIKLLGDSITHGMGGTGFETDGELIAEGVRRNPNGYCWGNLFAKYMQEQYGCKVVNNGCSGTTSSFVLEFFDQLVEEDDDIIICTIGTNNRHQFLQDGPIRNRQEHMELFYRDILAMNEKFKNTGKDYIFVANIPASAENEKDGEDYIRLCHMNDIQDLYTKASIECGFPLISLYHLFLDYCETHGITVDSLLADGLHPNDAGYDVIYRLLMKEFGLARKISG